MELNEILVMIMVIATVTNMGRGELITVGVGDLNFVVASVSRAAVGEKQAIKSCSVSE